MQIYSLFDRKALEYGGLQVLSNDAMACRALVETLSRDGSTVSKYPEDFDLYCLGSFSAESGEIDASMPSRLVVNLGTLLKGGVS